MTDRGQVMKGIVKDFDLIPKGTEKLLRGRNAVNFSFLIHYPEWGDQVRGHVNRGLGREDSSVLGLGLEMERVERFKIFSGVKWRK